MDTENKDLFENTEEVETEIIDDTAEDSFTTLGVDKEDIDSELQRYGVNTEAEYEDEAVQEEVASLKKTCIVQKPIIIAAICFAITAAVLFGTFFVYNYFFKKSISGVWQCEDFPEGIYFVFDKKGNVSVDGGGMRYEGTYTFEEAEDGTYTVNSGILYVVGLYTDNAVVTFGDDKKSMTLTTDYFAVEFIESELPALEIDANKITHASADEIGFSTLNIDDALLGEWTETIDETSIQMGYPQRTIILNEDGTGSEKYHYDLSVSYGFEYFLIREFKYTVYDGAVYMTSETYNGEQSDSVIEGYSINDNTLITPDGKYTKAE